MQQIQMGAVTTNSVINQERFCLLTRPGFVICLFSNKSFEMQNIACVLLTLLGDTLQYLLTVQRWSLWQ